MSRLVDYFAVVGYDHEKDRGGVSHGIVIQRFPEVDWPDTPFHEGLEWFCQPLGWSLSSEQQEPRFLVSVLTDVYANRHYCACLCFNETVAFTPVKPADEDEEVELVPSITHHSLMYAPKCIVIVSRQDYIETFKNCLGTIYTVWIENVSVSIESIVGNLLGCILVPPPGGPQIRFSIGAGDRQALQPPAAPPLPTTNIDVHMLFTLLGTHNAISLWCAVMSEQKVLLVSLAASRLASACRALAALMFPFRYAHVYIPILPASLLEVLSTPTPFLIGIHSNLKENIDLELNLNDVIVADLDVGSVTGLESTTSWETIPICTPLRRWLALVTQPSLRTCDAAFPSLVPVTPSQPVMLDKEIRAVFMRTFAQLLQGYRSCLTIIRIHPTPVLTFHKGGFLGARGLANCQFTRRLLDCMFFNGFVSERGPPWRPSDLWDDLYQNLPEQLRLESVKPDMELVHIQELAKQILLNENPNPQTYQQRIPRPPEGVATRIHQPPFPRLDPEKVRKVIEEGLAKNAGNPKLNTLRAPLPRIIPLGAAPTGADEATLLLTNSARRLEVLLFCVGCIFEGRYADARKSFPAALRSLRSPAARTALTNDLHCRLSGNKCLLNHQQFDLIVRLINCALQSSSAVDEHSVAAAVLPLATAYCRKLCTGVMQYVYMCIQEHQVWQSQQFWEAAFYQDVQSEIKALYLQSPTHQQRNSRDNPELQMLLKSQEPSALEIAAEQMRLWSSFDSEKKRAVCANEESTLYSQAIHYANRMVYLLLPLEGAGRRDGRADECDRVSNSITNSVAESDSADAESGFDEADPGEAGNNVVKMVSRFVDKVCTEGCVSAEHVRCLHQMIPGVVHMQLEVLDAVARESKRLPPVQRPRILPPTLVNGETIVGSPLRAYLLPDGRDSTVLPAEGELFLTDYRVIFKGVPTDPFANEQTVIRTFPLCSLTRDKVIRTNYIPQLDQTLQEGLQLRSCTFQLIKVALDADSEACETYRKNISRLRHPPHVLHHFAFNQRHHIVNTDAPTKNTTLKGFAKKTLLKTARLSGLKPLKPKPTKYVLPAAAALNRSSTSPPLMTSLSADTLSLDDMESVSVEGVDCTVTAARTMERLCERSYSKDWTRMGLHHAPFRLSNVNALYTLAHSYPALIPVPLAINDDSLRRIARCYKQSRFPVITWRHPRTGAILVRSSGCHHKGVIGMLKGSSHQAQPSSVQSTMGSSETTTSIEQERYLNSIVACTPGNLHDSTLSLDSLLLTGDESNTHTPLLTKHLGTLGVFPRGSGGKGGKGANFARWGSLKDKRASHLEMYASSGTMQRQRLSGTDADSVCEERRRVYIICDKGSEVSGGCECVGVEYPDSRATRTAFKKLLRATVPSAPQAEPGYHRLIEESNWLWQLRQLFQLSGAVIDLIDLQGSSVILSLEDGWDVTAQVSSLAQICLDPYYRKMEGFRVLIEKEWLAMGHKFQQRLNLSSQPQQGFTPTFLQFLDAVHQLQKQFPMAFEFNELYLRMIAYHSVSCRFRTFLLDNEASRVELGIAAVDDKRGSLTHRHRGVETGATSDDESIYPGGASITRQPALGNSLFDYLDKYHQRSPIFYNFMYAPDVDNPILRAQSSIPTLEVWEYYLSEELGTGAAYDLELSASVDPGSDGDSDASNRRTVAVGYDSIYRSIPDAFSGLLERIRHLELELGHLPKKWKFRWDQLELPNSDQFTRHASISSGLVRRAHIACHKRSTLELVAGGRVASTSTHHHRFVTHTAPATCHHCAATQWYPLKGVRCTECNVTCHEKCAELLPGVCPARNESKSLQADSPVCKLPNYGDYTSNVAENRTHEGHLYKRGALLKGWKQRWFVLDSIKHQLRYYDAMEDCHCKGFIDLAEVIAVTQAPPTPGPPKKTDDRSFFDLRTSRRTYNFCASDATSAQEWIEKLQACLQ